jgi:hypothetical protein
VIDVHNVGEAMGSELIAKSVDARLVVFEAAHFAV